MRRASAGLLGLGGLHPLVDQGVEVLHRLVRGECHLANLLQGGLVERFLLEQGLHSAGEIHLNRSLRLYHW